MLDIKQLYLNIIFHKLFRGTMRNRSILVSFRAVFPFFLLALASYQYVDKYNKRRENVTYSKIKI